MRSKLPNAVELNEVPPETFFGWLTGNGCPFCILIRLVIAVAVCVALGFIFNWSGWVWLAAIPAYLVASAAGSLWKYDIIC